MKNLKYQDILEQFFNETAKNDSEYFQTCYKLLLKEDQALLNKYIKLNKNI